MGDDERIERLETVVRELSERVARLEGRAAPVAPAAPPPTRVPPRAPAPAPAGPALDLEDLLGGRVLAWVGSVAVLLGIVFFLATAIRRGWIDEPTRTVLAFLGSTLLVLAGVWLYERKGRTEAALAAVAAGLAGLYATLVVATQVYELVSSELGLACAGVAGAAGTALAVRWSSTVVAAIGLLGALLAPVLVDAGTSSAALLFMGVALAATIAVLVWQKWNWLGLAAFVVSAPQLIAWLDDANSLVLELAALGVFWALFVVAAVGYELRTRTPEQLPYASWLLLLLDVVLVSGGGYAILDDAGHGDAAIAWVLGLAVVHVGLGTLVLRAAVNREIGSLLVGVGLALSAIAFADALDGPVLVAGWAAQAVVLAYLSSRAGADAARAGSNADRLALASGAYLALCVGHVLAFEAPPDSLSVGVVDLGEAAVALALVAGAALAVGRLLRERVPKAHRLAVGLATAALVYLGSVAIVDRWGVDADGSRRQAGQVWLSAYWTGLGLVGVVVGLARDLRELRLAALGLLGVAATKVFLYDLAQLDEIYRVLSFVALGLLLLAGAFAYGRARRTGGGGTA